MKRILLIGFMLLAVSGCGANNVETKIAGRVRAQCETPEPCIIRLSDLTDFQWDEMYVFEHSASVDQIEQVLGIPVTENNQFTRKVVFRWQGYVVRYEELPTDVSNLVDGQVVFDIPYREVYKSYSVDAAVFRVEKREFKDGIYYELRQVTPELPRGT